MNFFKGFFFAGRGFVYAVEERNFRFHLCAAALVIYFGANFYSFSKGEWAALLLTCAAVISLEAVNTAIERLCDKICPEKDGKIKIIKDISAGAVLVTAIFAAVIGVIFFWDEKSFSLIIEFFSEPIRLVILIAVLVLMSLFVFLPNKKRQKPPKSL